MGPSPDDVYARLAVTLGFLTAARADAALAHLRSGAGGRDVEAVLLEEGALTPDQARRIRECVRVASAPEPTRHAGDGTDGDARGAQRVDATAHGGPDGGAGADTLAGGGADAALPPGAVPKDRYEILGEIGRGGMGVVYRARQHGLERTVALKILTGGAHASPEEVERFRREARAAARLRHPGIVEVFDVGELDGRPYIAMAHVEGLSLDRHLAARALDVRTRVGLVRNVAEAVEHAHSHGIVHRDLKPANILIDAAGNPRVADFGLAKEVSSGDETSDITRSGAVIGTPQFMSPEQAEGAGRLVDRRSDVYSLGAVLYHALAGRPPFQGDTVLAVLFQVLNDWPAPPSHHRPGVHGDLDAVCLRALERDPARRYPSAAALAADLDRFLAGESVEARPVTAVTRALRRIARHRVLSAAAAASALLVVGLSISAWDTDRARRRAESGEAAALETLRKAGLVARVFARWNALEDTLRSLESIRHDSSRSPEERRTAAAKLWPTLDVFLSDTPDDSASRATARALAGWARRLAGEEEEGIAWMREAARLDPDLAHGTLLEALARFAEYTGSLELPTITILPTGIDFGTLPEETERQRSLRGEIESLLARTETARVWGREGAEDLQSAVRAMRAWQAGDFVAAEDALSQALAAPDLRLLAGGLRLARAKARYLRRRFGPGREDIAALRVLRPAEAEVLNLAGAFESALAAECVARGEDARVLRKQAIDSISAAIAKHPSPHTLDARGNAWLRLAEEEADRGEDPRPSLERGVADHTESLRMDPERSIAYMSRGNVLIAWGDAETERGIDARERYRRAIEDFDAGLARNPEHAELFCNRATAWRSLGVAESMRGGDAEAIYARALADCDASIRLRPGLLTSWATRANVNMALAHVQAGHGKDARPALERAAADAGEAIRIDPSVADSWATRGSAYLTLANAEELASLDPRPTLRKALADQDESLLRKPGHGMLLNNRGLTHWMLGRTEAKYGGNAAPSFQAALADFDAALRVLPNLWALHASKGLLLESMGDLAGTVAAFEQVVRLNPGHAKMKAALANYRARLQTQREAEKKK